MLLMRIVFISCWLFHGCLSSSLELVQILFRHGDRTPIKPFQKDTYIHYWKEGYGQLTDIGKKQQYALGQYFRNRYKSFLNETYNMDEILVNSTDTDRTLMSATVHLAGLYPPVGDQIWNKKLRWQPVPVHTKQKEGDYILDTDSYCPKYSRLTEEVLKSPEMLRINEENSGLYKLVTNETGTLVTNIFSINSIYDTLFIEKNNNLTIPTWVDDVYRQMRNLSNLSFSWICITHEERRLRGGPLIGHLITNMNLKINRTNEKRKLYLYSSHDTSVAALLSALSIFNGIAPPYACAVIVELHSLSDGGYGVQILYKNSTENDPIILTLPNCTAMCPFDQFVALTSSTVPEDIISECEVPKSVWTQFPWTITSVVLSLTLLFLLSLVCGIFCWKKRHNVNYRYMMVQNE